MHGFFYKINLDKEWTSSVDSFVIVYRMRTKVIMIKAYKYFFTEKRKKNNT